MSRVLKIGVSAVVVGLIGAFVNNWAADAFPDTWGGPNIGGGILQLGFYALIVVGAVLALSGVVQALRR
jgi:hypothetical protein